MSYVNETKKHLELLKRREGSLAVSIRALDAILAEHREQMHPQLVHYLSQRSYDKALLLLGGMSASSGMSTASGGSTPSAVSAPSAVSTASGVSGVSDEGEMGVAGTEVTGDSGSGTNGSAAGVSVTPEPANEPQPKCSGRTRR